MGSLLEKNETTNILENNCSNNNNMNVPSGAFTPNPLQMNSVMNIALQNVSVTC